MIVSGSHAVVNAKSSERGWHVGCNALNHRPTTQTDTKYDKVNSTRFFGEESHKCFFLCGNYDPFDTCRELYQRSLNRGEEYPLQGYDDPLIQCRERYQRSHTRGFSLSCARPVLYVGSLKTLRQKIE